MKKKKVTMQYIADKVGVSKVTVYKALRNKDGVSDDLRIKIEKLAKEYGYKAPTNEEEKKDDLLSKNIVIFSDNKFFDETDISCFYLGIYKKISKILIKKGCTGTLFTIQKGNDYIRMENILKSGQFDGVILLGCLDIEFTKMIDSIDIPKVFVDSNSTKTNSDNIIIENFYSTYKITKHLIENGHRDIGFVGSVGVTTSITDRYLGYYKALIENNIPVNKEWIVKDRDKNNEEVELVLPKVLPTAFVCNCDDTAFKFVKLLQNNGISVPQQVSIVSYDDDIMSRVCTPKLTTVAVDKDKMAQKAVEVILYRIDNKNAINPMTELINGRILCRDSVKKIG